MNTKYKFYKYFYMLSMVNKSNRKEILEMDFEGMSENETQFGTQVQFIWKFSS